VSNPNIQIQEANDFRFHAEDGIDARFYIRGRLVDGYLGFDVVAELPSGERGSVRGREFFDAMINHFGNAVTAIEGEWSDQLPGMTSNLDVFNRLTASGVPPDDAARMTWTGKMSEKHGFTNVTSINTRPPKAAGNYREVLVRFERP
jgi:hypothetical protein